MRPSTKCGGGDIANLGNDGINDEQSRHRRTTCILNAGGTLRDETVVTP